MSVSAPERRPGVLTGVLVVAMMLVAVWAAWPIYRDSSYLLMSAGALGAAVLIAAFGAARSWSWFTVLLVTLGAYLVLGVPLAVPSALASVPAALAGLLDLVTASVFGWKELVTIQLPVGSFQALLVPAFSLFLFGTTAALSLAWRSPRWHGLAVPLVCGIQLFGLVFGSSAVSAPTTIVGLTVPAPRESAIGVAALLLAFGYLAWRTHLARSRALDLATRSSGVQRTPGGLGGRVRRLGFALGVLALAVGVTLAGVSAVPGTPQRDVLRSGIDPVVDLRDYVSPLSQYRSYFSTDTYDTELFRVVPAADTAVPRVRLAVLSHYDGEVFRMIDHRTGDSDQTTAFARVPHTLGSTDGTLSTGFEILGYRGVWMPGAGPLASIRFAGAHAAALGDGFFYNAGTAAGIQLNPLAEGDRYTMVSERQADAAGLADLARPAAGPTAAEEALLPASLGDWVTAQQVGNDGAALAELVNRLRERGYLSHALSVPPAESWTADLGDYTFSPSLSGHSLARIDDLFTSLLEKQNSTDSTENSQLVAAVGDDEQFAVATALLARYLGFDSRVVVGFNLAAPVASEVNLTAPACPGEVCSGGNLSAWVEVAGSEGGWVTVDATPQHENSLSPIDDATRDPQYSTEVLPEGATEQRAPDANPTSGEDQQEEDPVSGPDLAWLFAALKIAGISLLAVLVVCTPLLVILGAKLKRRLDRARAENVSARFAGGWDEYVDTAVDLGFADQGSMTRVEIATRYESAGGRVLAALADQAVFGPEPPQASDSEAFWTLVAAERARFAANATRRERLRAALSLRSFSRLADTRRFFGARSRAREDGRYQRDDSGWNHDG
ncbi:transglutaminase domain-containing protein [Cryobacterium roopkundense]|uniref:Transglutaminase-like domain-containing protein n=1 Tax=Cryobacterium roopkundense TaxID=1001240 RepID=A0A7W8ZSQ0_9MICO|nr:transglutaminase domain-containing protein [Cryobacterium roopkundense]MBB5639496.1 hypothetical protein [Cryobacterium roopkundense]